MANVTVRLPAPLQEWAEKQVESGDYSSTGDYMQDLVLRDRQRRDPDHQYTLDELEAMLERSRQSGISTRTPGDIFAAALAHVEARRARRG